MTSRRWALAFACWAAACGSESKNAAPKAAAPTAAPAPKDAGGGGGDDAAEGFVLRRSEVRRAIKRGLGAILAYVTLADEPVFVAGKFHGFRIERLRGSPAMWRDVGIQPGDVVVRVQGMPIERPEDAQAAFQSLDVASELRIDLERDGKPMAVRFPIADDASKP